MTKQQKKIYNWLLEHPGYIKKSPWKIPNPLNYTVKANILVEDMKVALKQARYDIKKKYLNSKEFSDKICNNIGEELKKVSNEKKVNKLSIGKTIYKFEKFKTNFKDTPWGRKLKEYSQKTPKSSYNLDNVLFIADLHAPWILDGYIDWCKEQQNKYNCGTIIFSGDIIDSGAWNYFEKNPDGMGVKDELYAAKKQLKSVYEAFPNAIVLLGNHDLLISRKAKTAGLSQEFIKGLGDILEAPKTWRFVHEYKKDNVLYIHGSVGDAFKRAVDSRISICQGHIHSKTFVQWSVSEKDAIFGLQVGGGFNRDKYAFEYAKPFAKKPIIGCGIILDKGTTPLVKLMPL